MKLYVRDGVTKAEPLRGSLPSFHHPTVRARADDASSAPPPLWCPPHSGHLAFACHPFSSGCITCSVTSARSAGASSSSPITELRSSTPCWNRWCRWDADRPLLCRSRSDSRPVCFQASRFEAPFKPGEERRERELTGYATVTFPPGRGLAKLKFQLCCNLQLTWGSPEKMQLFKPLLCHIIRMPIHTHTHTH